MPRRCLGLFARCAGRLLVACPGRAAPPRPIALLLRLLGGLGHIEQKTLKITIANSGSVTAEGKVDDLAITVLGSGDAKLGKLAARNVTVQIMGSGDVTTAPSEELKATIMGSGDLRLRTRPARAERHIMGSGEIIEPR